MTQKPGVKKGVPFEFVLEELADLNPRTNPMFGCTAVYVGERIVLILREKEGAREDNGVWLATTPEHHESLAKEFPSMRSIALFGPGVTGWQVLPDDSEDFESAALRVCALIRRGDTRIGKIPKPKKSKAPKGQKVQKAKSRSASQRP